MIKGRWIYMIESDYVFMKPLPIPSEESQVGPCVGASGRRGVGEGVGCARGWVGGCGWVCCCLDCC